MIPVIPTYVLLIVKVLGIVGILLYTGFAAVLVRQEQLMAHVLEESFEPVLRILVLAHLVAAIGLLFLAFILL
ncbi:MAG: hypothetical protein UY49_C0034G0002 [Microgenomates group bacterium GW2011_GWC1_49_7]|nr:MAG: hypothetical protein UY49_C0034G0002 [Microgenomates group bacterium GW2011_GWC1_49_7]